MEFGYSQCIATYTPFITSNITSLPLIDIPEHTEVLQESPDLPLLRKGLAPRLLSLTRGVATMVSRLPGNPPKELADKNGQGS